MEHNKLIKRIKFFVYYKLILISMFCFGMAFLIGKQFALAYMFMVLGFMILMFVEYEKMKLFKK